MRLFKILELDVAFLMQFFQALFQIFLDLIFLIIFLKVLEEVGAEGVDHRILEDRT
jgi:hypothetical protein